MGLAVEYLRLRDWRSFSDRTVSLCGGLTVLAGPNATGKTNTVEALQLLTSGTSFRRPRPQELVREGAEVGRIDARLAGDGRVVDVALAVEGGRRRFERNGKPARPADLSSTLMSVLFCPDDLNLVKGGAAMRRDELDAFGAAAAPSFRRVCRAYGRALEQRNRLLKEPVVDWGLVEAWSDQVALGGATLLKARMALFERLEERMRRIYAEVAGEELEGSYECSLGDVAGLGRDEVRDLFLRRLAELRGDEERRRMTLVGPQRDDVCLAVSGRDARTFASQGQQRSVVLAWKMAEVAVAAEVTGERPLLLLDDVMSELDERRREALCRLIEGGVQSVVTTAHLDYFPRRLLEEAEVVRFGDE